MRFMISGSAKLRWFLSGLTLVEATGSPDVCGLVLNLPDRPKFGSVGQPLPGLDVRIAKTASCWCSPVVTRRYRPAGRDRCGVRRGWFHTGDIAHSTTRAITDRKDLIKTSTASTWLRRRSRAR